MRVPRRKMGCLIRYVVAQEQVEVAEVNVAVVDDDQMEQLNRFHLGHTGTTDVLSFDLTDSGSNGLTLEIIISGPVARRTGPKHGLSATRELLLYVTHGLLHQMGYDDQDALSAQRMRDRQMQLLEGFLKQY